LATFGFLDIYPKLERNHKDLKDTDDKTKIEISLEFKRIAKKSNMELRLCSKEKWLKEYDIDVNGCMRLEDYERSIGKNLIIKKRMDARKNYCSCLISNDIGMYNTCPHLCKYCYANGDKKIIIDNYMMHNPNSPLLIGDIKEDDIIKDANQESYIDRRISLF
jgi:hypothetical protein